MGASKTANNNIQTQLVALPEVYCHLHCLRGVYLQVFAAICGVALASS